MFHVKHQVKMNNKKNNIYEIIVIGAGLAGSEAGFISSNCGLRTLIINISMDNPAILKYAARFGEVSSDVLLNKIETLGGFINSAIYENKIAQKSIAGKKIATILNIVDKRKFSLFYKYSLENQRNLETRQGLVTGIEINNKEKEIKYLVKLSDGSKFFSKAIIISVGTFLNSTIFWGKNKEESGRDGEINSKKLYESLTNMNYDFKKKVVYISPRIDRRSLNLKKIKNIKSEVDINTMEVKMHECSNGYIKDISIDKTYCYKTKISKQVLLECIDEININYKSVGAERLLKAPICKIKLQDSKTEEFEIEMFSEGGRTMELYVNEFDFIFSDEEQNLILNKFYGLENAAIIRPGYCIEYEGLKQEFLKDNLESKIHENIFFAGEVNMPQSYESIAMQGLIAGINAAKNILSGK